MNGSGGNGMGQRGVAAWMVRLAWLLLALLAAPAIAQEPLVTAAAHQLTQASTDLRDVDRALDGRVDDKMRQTLRDKALAARDAANDAATSLQGQLGLVDDKVAQLGPVAPGITESPDIRSQRATLASQRSLLDSTIKRGRLLAVEAQQLADEIQQSVAAQFGERISARVASPLSPAFWSAVIQAMPRDTRRIAGFVRDGADQVRAHHGFPWQALVGALIAVALLLPVQAGARRFGQRLLVEGAPGRRVRRSANALWRMVVGTLAPMFAGLAVVQGLRWSGLVAGSWGGLLDALAGAAGFAGFTVAALGALLMRSQPSWRVAPISDAVAMRLRPFSWLLAGLAFASILVDAFNVAVGASHAALIASETVEALLHLLLVGGALFAVGQLRAAHERDRSEAMPAQAGLGAATLLLWLLVATALVALLLGYVGFSLFLGQLTAWGVVLGATTYLLMAAIDDVATSVFLRDSPFGLAVTRGLGLGGSAIDQFGVLLSGVLRVALAIVAIGLLMSPFGAGSGIGALFGRLSVAAQGLEVGGVAISPGAILRGVVVLLVGLALVRAFMRWLEGRYLPATDLDGSGRNSVSLVTRYVGTAIAVIWALASLGIGVERIALLLSALSVGIGFGLQAITQNFVSGLILLAERPIKIGDLIRVGTDEGDVKRISVRSTEIELPDHSTLIVPNSELITKTVLNKTLQSPLGRIQIKFSVPIEADADRVRGIVSDTFAAEDGVLADPAPKVFIETITDGRILFNCFAHVASPRAVYAARSNVLLVLLRRFRKEGIEMGTGPQKLELVTPFPERAPDA